MSTTKVFAIALFLVFGTFLFSCTDANGQKVGEITVNKTALSAPLEPQNFMVGSMLFEVPSPPIDSITETCTMISGDTIITINEEHVDGGIDFMEVSNETAPVMDSVNLDEVVIVDYLEPLIDTEIISTRVMATTGLISVCVFQSDSIIEDDVNKTLGKPSALTIFPNPSNGEFTIKYFVKKRANISLEIYDLKGILIKTVVHVSNQYEGNYQIPVNLNELPNGIYLVNLIKDNKKFVERLVIER